MGCRLWNYLCDIVNIHYIITVSDGEGVGDDTILPCGTPLNSGNSRLIVFPTFNLAFLFSKNYVEF